MFTTSNVRTTLDVVYSDESLVAGLEIKGTVNCAVDGHVERGEFRESKSDDGDRMMGVLTLRYLAGGSVQVSGMRIAADKLVGMVQLAVAVVEQVEMGKFVNASGEAPDAGGGQGDARGEGDECPYIDGCVSSASPEGNEWGDGVSV